MEIQICSIQTDSDVACEKLKQQYLRGNYTELRKVRTQKKIRRIVAVETELGTFESTIVEWKPHHIPSEQLVIEYRNVCEEVTKQREHSTVTPHLQHKLHRLEKIIITRS